MKILLILILFSVNLSEQFLCPDTKYSCQTGQKCCASGYPWTLYECCPLTMQCCGRTCCQNNELCCGHINKAGSVCCDSEISMCCGENQFCYDKKNYKCCPNGEACPKDTTCCDKVLKKMVIGLKLLFVVHLTLVVVIMYYSIIVVLILILFIIFQLL